MIDLSKKENRTKEAYIDLKKCSIDEYLKTGVAKYCHKQTLLFSDGRYLFSIQDMKAYYVDSFDYYVDQEAILTGNGFNLKHLIPTALLVPSKEKNRKYNLLRNGDVAEDDPTILTNGKFDTTVSFNCLSILLNNKKHFTSTSSKENQKVLQRILDNEIVVVDSTSDVKKPLTKKEKAKNAAEIKKPRSKRNIVAPVGFTYVKGVWHMSATVLICDKTTEKTFILGQDEGMYFGCELVDNPKTIKDAYTSMIPLEIRNKRILGRHGEWFVIPVAEKNVPQITDCITSDDYVNLPIDDKDSARHYVSSSDIRIKDNKIYAKNGQLRHSNGDHADFYWYGWATFVHNRVARSVSQKGVD